MNKANECTCPSGDGSLVHPCPAHPAPVEQAGGDERAAFEQWEAEQISFVLRQIGSMDTGDIDGDDVDLRFEDADGRDTGCDVSIVEYADKAANLIEAMLADHAALAQPSPTLPPFAEKVLAKLRRFYDCAEDFESGGVDIGRHWLDLLTQLGLLNRVQRSPALWEISQQGEDFLGTPHPSPAQAEQAEAERPEVVGQLVTWPTGQRYVGRVRERKGCKTEDVMTVAQHERIVGELRAVIAQLRQHKNDYMDSGQETYRALQNEIREREAEIARLDGLVSGRTAERGAALARVAEMEALMQMNFGELHTARNLLSRLSVSGVNVDAILGGQLQDLVIVPADATLEMVEALKRRLTVTNRGTLLNAGHALNASIAASPFAKKAPEPVMCPRCEGEGTLRTGIDESPSTICKRCDGVGTIAAAPGKEVGHE